MPELIKKSVTKIDWLIILMGVIIFAGMDYSNLAINDIIFIVSFLIWLVLLFVRIFIYSKNEEKENEHNKV